MKNEMLCGVAYHPNFLNQETWKQDLSIMKKTGINLIRTCELFNGWDQMEPEEGRFDFKLIDDFMDACYQIDIQVMLGTGTASPPQWLKKIDPDLAIETVHGHHYPSDASYSWACPHNPTYEYYWKRYLSKLVIQYKDHPALFGYQIHNEIGLPFMSQDGHVDVYCYCKHTKKAFRNWVQEKYQNLDALNHAWTWSTSNPYYATFDDVTPPSHMPKAWSSVTRWLDFRLFMMDSMTAFVEKQNQWIKQYDTFHPTCVNTFMMKGEDKLGVMCAIDPFALANVCDCIGYDLYPGSSNKELKYPEFASMFLDYARSTAYKNDGQFWMLETESGPINGWALGPHNDTNEDNICRNVVKNIGHNAKMELYMLFREYPFQPINWGGLLDLQGNETKRLAMVKKLNDCIQTYHLQASELSPRPAQIAILLSRENAILCVGFGHDDFLVESIRAHYQMFWRLGYDIDFITPDQANRFCEYQVISAPFLLTCDEYLLNSLEQYVKQGGVVYGEPRFSFLDEKGWYQMHRPAQQLQKIFGIKHSSIECVEEGDILCENTMNGYWHKESIELVTANEFVNYCDHSPAIVQHAYGEGNTLYATSYFALAASKRKEDKFLKVMQDFLMNLEIKPYVTYEACFDKKVDIQLLEDDNRLVLCIEPSLTIEEDVEINLKVQVNNEIKGVRELFTDQLLDFTQDGNEVRISFLMQAKKCAIIELR